MKLNTRSLMITTALLFSLPLAARAEIFEYSQNLYNIDAANCQTHATELAQRIAQSTGGATKSAYCAPVTGGGFDARVVTEVSSLPKLETAVFGFRVIVYDYPGRTGAANKNYSVISDESTYIHVADCLAVLPNYEAHFRTQTGLDPTSAQCAALAGGRYVPQVDSFGTGRRHLFETSISIGSASSSEAIQLDVSNYLYSVGATPTNAARPSSFIQIKYYADAELNLTAYNFAHKNYFNSEAECLAAVNVAQPLLSQNQSLKVVSLRCGGGNSSNSKGPRSMLAVLDLNSSDQPTPNFKVYTVGHFPTYAECSLQVPHTPRSYCAADVDIYGNFHGYAQNVID
jgi:hypothetical protein